MKWISPSPVDKTISLIRPLLNFSKAELIEFAREQKVQYRNDATNFSVDFLRNRIRNELLPLIHEDYQPGLDKTVLRLMDIVGAEAEFVSDAAKKYCAILGSAAQPETGNQRPATGNESEASSSGSCKFEELPLAVQRKVLQQQLSGFGLMPDFDLVEHLRNSPEKKASVSPALSVVRDVAGKVYCQEDLSGEFSSDELVLKISGKAGRGEFGGQRFRWRVEELKQFRLPLKSPVGGASARREFFDADKIGNEIILRHWQPGDRFQPIGLKSAVKLQDLFVNAKIPSARRANWYWLQQKQVRSSG